MWSTEVLKKIPSGDGGSGTIAFPLTDLSSGLKRPFQLPKQGEDWGGIREGNKIMAIIATPTLDDRVRYQGKVDKLFEKVKEWVPGCQTMLATYPQDRSDTIEGVIERQKTSPEGKVLFQYDPRDHVGKVRDENGRECDRWQSRVRVYVGSNEWPV